MEMGDSPEQGNQMRFGLAYCQSQQRQLSTHSPSICDASRVSAECPLLELPAIRNAAWKRRVWLRHNWLENAGPDQQMAGRRRRTQPRNLIIAEYQRATSFRHRAGGMPKHRRNARTKAVSSE
jgi:hypothetical protein